MPRLRGHLRPMVTVKCTIRDNDQLDSAQGACLGAIGVGARVGHGEDTSARMREPRVQLILEGGPIDGFAPRACACRVATLHSKPRWSVLTMLTQ